MSVPTSLLPELEDVVQHGSAEKRAETLRRITTLFLDGASSFHAKHIALFDDVIGCLIEEIEALAELARRIAPVANAPAGVVSTLAKNDDIAVAGPVLKQARLADRDLLYIAENKSQAHLLAMSTRQRISEALSDILVSRGDCRSRSIAVNRYALSGQCLDAGETRGRGQRAGGEGRHAHRHSATVIPAAADARERGRAEAPAC
jgi:uncharacterized protein (DUF2336 family)